MSNQKTGPLPDFDLVRFTPYRLTVAAQKLSEGLARQYRKQYGISVSEWRVLVHLTHSANAAGNVSIRDIESRVAMEKSKVSRAAARLEEAGYVTKHVNDHDRRLVCLGLSPKGKALMAQLLPLAIQYQREIEEKLGEAFEGLQAGVEKLLGENE